MPENSVSGTPASVISRRFQRRTARSIGTKNTALASIALPVPSQARSRRQARVRSPVPR
jgi:hypothetical protein